ncbi:MAG TPA: cytochrome P450 [Methylomirabilota bacterium]|nr:cytochrome P450 [Methylomirabilota bacterium]
MASAEALFDPFLPDFNADPYPFYQRLREVDPVHQSPLGFWVLTRYDDCVMVLRDPRFGRAGFEAMLESVYGGAAEPGRLPTSMLFRDPPDHTRLRGLVSRAFTPRVIEGLRPRIQQIVDGLLDRIQEAGRMEVIADLAYPLPVTVISEMLGVPEDDRERIKQWSADIARSLDAIGLPTDQEIVERGRTGRRAIGDYFRSLIPDRKKRPRGDLLSLLIEAEEQGDKLSEGELLATCVLLYIAGHETTVNLIGNGLLALLRHPAELKRLRDDPALTQSAVEELLRYDGPVQRTARITNADVEIGGHKIAHRSMVVTVIGAANRDPAHFPDPDRLDISRPDNRHIAFGFGIHFCLGAPLARLEGQIALGTLVRRLPRLTLATDRLEWRESQVLRGLKSLPVSC